MTAADFTPERIAELRAMDPRDVFDRGAGFFWQVEEGWTAMLDAIEGLQAIVIKQVSAMHRLDFRWDGGWWADCCERFTDDSRGNLTDLRYGDAKEARERAFDAHEAHLRDEKKRLLGF